MKYFTGLLCLLVLCSCSINHTTNSVTEQYRKMNVNRSCGVVIDGTVYRTRRCVEDI
jgi:hypothetical protein